MKITSSMDKLMDKLMNRLLRKLGCSGVIALMCVLLLLSVIGGGWVYNSVQSNFKNAPLRHAQALLSKPKALVDEKKFEEAYGILNRLATGNELKNYPELHAEATFRAAHTLQMLERFDEALDRYNNFITQFPDSPLVENALYLRGWCYYDLQNYEVARSSLIECLDRFPNSQFKEGLQDVIKRSLIQEAQALLSKPKALADEKRYEEAYEGFNRLVTGDELKNYPELHAEATFRAAHVLHMLDRFDEALDRYNNFITQFPDSSWVENTLYAIGVLNFYGLSNYVDCRDVLGTLLDRYPNSTFKDSAQRLLKVSFLKEAQGLLDEENYKEAQKEFNRLATGPDFEDHPELQTVAKSKATYSFLKQVGKDDEKLIPYIDFLTESSETELVEDNALFNIGILSFKLKNYEASLGAFEQLRENLSDSDLKASAVYNIGMANYNLRNYKDCRRALTEFLSEFPNSSLREKALYYRGDANYNLQDYEDSRDDFRELLDSFPNSEFKNSAERFIATSAFEEAKLLLEAKKYELAYQEFDRLIASGKFENYLDLQAELMYRVAYSLKLFGRENENKAINANALGHNDQAEAFNNQKVIAYAKALDRYTDFIKQFPESQSVISAYIDSGNIHLRRAESGNQLEAEYDNARVKYEEALKRTDDLVLQTDDLVLQAEILSLQAEILSQIGKTYYDQGDSKNAISAYTKLLKEHPDSKFVVDAKLRIADSHFRRHQWNAAISAYSRVITEHKEAKEHIPRCSYQIAEAYYKLATDDQKSQLDQEIQSQIDFEMAEKAKHWYQKILDDFPTDEVASYALYGLMRVLNDLERKDELERLVLEHGISSSIPISNALSDIDLTGLSYFKLALNQEEHLKNYKEALESYQKAIPRVENPLIRAKSYYRLGLIYQDKLDSPDKNKALEMFQTLISEYGNSENPSIVPIVTDARVRHSELSNNGKPLELDFELIGERARGSTVLLQMENTRGQVIGSGSGFFVGPGQIATNYHVVRGKTGGYAELVVENITNEGNMRYDIQGYIAIDMKHDLIILKVSGLNPPFLSLSKSDAVERNNPVYAVGTPLGHRDMKGTISHGTISNLLKDETGKRIRRLMMTAPISPGNSGGPVLNDKGEVIGIAVAQRLFRDPVLKVNRAQNLNLAIPVYYLRELLKKIGPPRPLWQAGLTK